MGGYFCQIYNDEMSENEIDNFVLHTDELIGQDAENLASKYVKSITEY